MKKILAKYVACLTALLPAIATSCASANQAPDTYCFEKTGVASIRIGADYTAIPDSCPGLYSHAIFQVCCGGEDGEGVDIWYCPANSDDYIICASLDMDQATIETLFAEDLACNSYPLTDVRLGNLLKQSGSTKIGYITVKPSPHITVPVNGEEIATSEPAVKFMTMPGAETGAAMEEGLSVTCIVDGLYLSIMNAYDALTPEASERICGRLSDAMERGEYEKVTVEPSDLKPGVCFDYINYLVPPSDDPDFQAN